MSNLRVLSNCRFLIIGGTSKAGTTSVFNYLAGHPQICPSTKETRFFLDPDYPLVSTKRYQENGPETYLSFFNCESLQPKDNWRLEATPDYLYSANTPHVIRQTLENVRFIFILREPISRLLSWYRFGQAMNEIRSSTTFDDYVGIQRETGGSFRDGYRHPAFAALQHGRYSIYLKRFVEVFGTAAIQIFFYEDLRRDSFSFMTAICRLLGINETYFRNYSFNVVNKGVDVRSPYLHDKYWRAKQRLRVALREAPNVRRVLRQIGDRTDAAYRRVNVTESRKVLMAFSTAEFLCSYYHDEAPHLKNLLGTEAPWSERQPSSLIEFTR
jgi:hypothetical protein